MRLRLNVAERLARAALLFHIPVANVMWQLLAEQAIAIQFAAKEVAGSRLLAQLVNADYAAERAAHEKAPFPTTLLQQIQVQQEETPQRLGALDAMAKTIQTAHGADQEAAHQS